MRGLRDFSWFRRTALVAAAALLLGGALGVVPASANQDCQDTSWLCPEHASQRYWWAGSVSSAWETAFNDSRVEDIEPSDINTSQVSLHSNSDVHVAEANYGDNNAYAITYCQDPSGSVCLHWHIEINDYNFTGNGESPPYGSAHKNMVACQELGHAAGLLHHSSDSATDPSCMFDSHAAHNPDLNTHDINHINGIV